LSRLRIFTLLAIVAVLALALTACGGDDDGGGGSDEDPQAVLDKTFSSDAQVESADINLSLDASIEGEESGSLDASLTGAVDGKGDTFPKFDLTASVEGEGGGQTISFEGGAISTGDAAYVSYGGDTYELGQELFGLLEQAYQQGQQQQAQQQSSTAGLDQLKNSLTNLQNEGTEDVEGTETVHISGELDVPTLVDELRPLLEQASQLGAIGGTTPTLPSASELEQLQRLVKSATFDVYSGTEDDILRRFAFEMQLQDPAGGGDTADIAFDFTLGDVNGDFSIDAPSDAKPIDELFSELGIDPSALGALGLGGGGSLGGGSAGGGSGSGSTGDPSAFFDCLNQATTAEEIQACSALAP
jgi:hypothetical protein